MHDVFLSAGVTQKATNVSDMAGHRGFNEGLLLPSTECGDSGRLASIHYRSPKMPETYLLTMLILQYSNTNMGSKREEVNLE